MFPRINKTEDHKRRFLKVNYINRGIYRFDKNTNIFHDTNVQNRIPPYFDKVEPPFLPNFSYFHIGNFVLFLILKVNKSSRNVKFNYTSVTSDVNIDDETLLI